MGHQAPFNKQRFLVSTAMELLYVGPCVDAGPAASQRAASSHRNPHQQRPQIAAGAAQHAACVSSSQQQQQQQGAVAPGGAGPAPPGPMHHWGVICAAWLQQHAPHLMVLTGRRQAAAPCSLP